MSTDQPETSPGRGSVSGIWIVTLLVVFVAMTGFALYGMWAFWPSEGAKLAPLTKEITFFGVHRRLSRETLFFVMVAFAGGLGGMVHGLRSYSVYVGNRQLRWSWVAFYFLKPVLGAALATLLYIVLRAGLFSPSASSQQTSPYGFAAVGALAGLFTDQAVEKLRKVAEEVFEKLPPAKDAISVRPVVATGDGHPLGPTSASLTGTVNPRGRETTFHFEYGETEAYGLETPSVTAGSAQTERAVHARLQGLSPDTTYHYRIVAKSEAGTSDGEDRQLKTLAREG